MDATVRHAVPAQHEHVVPVQVHRVRRRRVVDDRHLHEVAAADDEHRHARVDATVQRPVEAGPGEEVEPHRAHRHREADVVPPSGRHGDQPPLDRHRLVQVGPVDGENLERRGLEANARVLCGQREPLVRHARAWARQCRDVDDRAARRGRTARSRRRRTASHCRSTDTGCATRRTPRPPRRRTTPAGTTRPATLRRTAIRPPARMVKRNPETLRGSRCAVARGSDGAAAETGLVALGGDSFERRPTG
jgi:hypothetical protein